MSNESALELEVIYEDTDCAVVAKPAGLMVHPDGRSPGPFLTDWVVATYPGAADVGEDIMPSAGEPIKRPGIVHRLDRDTSGAILIAKTKEGHARLKKQFQARKVSKKYLAFVWGEIKEEFGTIDRPIGRSANEYPKWSAQRGARGEMRDAETYWTRLWTGEDAVHYEDRNESKPEKFTLIQAEPKTGRTHQIRVHFQAINHPVVSDPLYAGKRPKALGFERMALHAHSIEFTDATGKRVKAVAPPPQDFVDAFRRIGIQNAPES